MRVVRVEILYSSTHIEISQRRPGLRRSDSDRRLNIAPAVPIEGGFRARVSGSFCRPPVFPARSLPFYHRYLHYQMPKRLASFVDAANGANLDQATLTSGFTAQPRLC